MKALISICLFAVLFTACSSSKKTSSSNSTTTEVAGDRDGSSYDKAIIINAKNETSGVDMEYAWLRKNYPGYKSKGQSLDRHNGKPYDIISIVTADGKSKDVYFDISKFFGKW